MWWGTHREKQTQKSETKEPSFYKQISVWGTQPLKSWVCNQQRGWRTIATDHKSSNGWQAHWQTWTGFLYFLPDSSFFFANQSLQDLNSCFLCIWGIRSGLEVLPNKNATKWAVMQTGWSPRCQVCSSPLSFHHTGLLIRISQKGWWLSPNILESIIL